jgi:uncharacterized protein (DUF2236 family)
VKAGELVGIPTDIAPRSVAELQAYLAGVPLLLTPGARRVRELALHPPISWRWRPLTAIFRTAVLDILPEPVRATYGFRLSERQRRATVLSVSSACRMGNALPRLPFREDMFAPVQEEPAT